MLFRYPPVAPKANKVKQIITSLMAHPACLLVFRMARSLKRVIASDKGRDIALLATEPPLGVRGLPLRLQALVVSSDVFALSAPNYQSFANTLTRGWGVLTQEGQDIKLNLFIPIGSGLAALGINLLPPGQ